MERRGRGDKTFQPYPGTKGAKGEPRHWGRGGTSPQKPSSKTQAAWVLTCSRSLPTQPAWQPDWPLVCLGAPDRSAHPALLWIWFIPVLTPPPLPHPAISSGAGVHFPRAVQALRRLTEHGAGPLGKQISPAQKGKPGRPLPLPRVPLT